VRAVQIRRRHVQHYVHLDDRYEGYLGGLADQPYCSHVSSVGTKLTVCIQREMNNIVCSISFVYWAMGKIEVARFVL
jgi:hypothetical protein